MNRMLRARRSVLAAAATVGALALSSCSFSAYDLPLPGGADLGDDPYAITVEFRDVLDLVPQSVVKVDDVSVGRVAEVDLDGYHARVELLVRGDVDLPDNARAEIRQTSLLGEKFVSLGPPDSDSAQGRLSEGDVIPLDRTGRNTEIEEFFSALSLVLNGGGIAQLRTIAQEINLALGGREESVKSVLRRLATFTAQFDEGKGAVVDAIEQLNQLSISLNEQRGSIELALDELPAALASIDGQRSDLVRMLGALDELNTASVDVIRLSKQGTIDSLQALDPVLTKLAEAGQDLPDSLSTLWTYPFIDEVVGRNPAAARSLRMGDYTNLSVTLDVDFTNGLPTVPGLPIPGGGPLPELPLGDLQRQLTDVQRCLLSGDANGDACSGLRPRQLRNLCVAFPTSPLSGMLCNEEGGPGGGGDGGAVRDLFKEVPVVSDLLGLKEGRSCSLPGVLCRPAPGGPAEDAGAPRASGAAALNGLLAQGIERGEDR
ncbi:MAG: MCE family protein [Nocardioides sp.]|nr:MCE family protein [Nocardioides sp.]